ncbi:MAG: hypothetical protein V4628_02195 [Pseudomonadota bacterium]
MKEKVEFERFEATDEDGQVFTIIGYQYFITHKPVYGVPVVLKGDMEYWTDTGLPVRKIDSHKFRIVTAAETITSLMEKFTSFGPRPSAIEVQAMSRYE